MIEILGYLAWIVAAGTKFLFTPSAMIYAGYSWMETLMVTTIGASLSVFIFYYGAELVGYYADKWRRKPKRIFKKSSRRLVRIKAKYGLKGLGFMGAFLSVPITAIIAAKYFNHPKRDIPALILSYFLWSLVLTTLSYASKWLFPG